MMKELIQTFVTVRNGPSRWLQMHSASCSVSVYLCICVCFRTKNFKTLDFIQLLDLRWKFTGWKKKHLKISVVFFSSSFWGWPKSLDDKWWQFPYCHQFLHCHHTAKLKIHYTQGFIVSVCLDAYFYCLLTFIMPTLELDEFQWIKTLHK